MAKKRNKKSSIAGALPLVLLAVFFIFLALYLAIPVRLETAREKRQETALTQMMTALASADEKDRLEIMTRFAVQENAVVSLECADPEKSLSTPSLTSELSDKQVEQITIDHAAATLTVRYASQEQSLLITVLRPMFLVATIVTMIILIIIFLFYGKARGEDFAPFAAVTKEMVQLKPSARLKTTGNSPAQNQAAANVNTIYERQLETMEILEHTRTSAQRLESKTKAVMQNETKRLLDTAQELESLVEGLLKKDERYQNQDVKLIEAKLKIADIAQNINNQPKVSDEQIPVSIQTLYTRLAAPYQPAALKKRVAFSYVWQKDFKITVDELLFTQAFDHMMAFILRQCSPQTNILIQQNNYDIYVAYKGAAFSDDTLTEVKNKDADIKDLFEIIRDLKLFIDFEPTQKLDGMQFVFHF